MLIIDAHLDIAYNSINFNRDLRLPVADIRAKEEKRPVPNGIAITSIPELLKGGIGLVFGSLFVMPKSMMTIQYDSKISYDDSLPEQKMIAQAHALAMRQLDYYHWLADTDERVLLIREWADVETVLASHETEHPKLGILIHMEGAEPLQSAEEVEMWYERGLRSIGLSWNNDTRFAPGLQSSGERLPREGQRLLERMASLGMIADITHMGEAATFDVLELYDGPVVATHCNARALVPLPRMLSDDQIHLLAKRDGVIGAALFNPFLRAGHRLGDAKELVTLDHAVAHIDHICQLIGSSAYVGIGTDWDGGLGSADIPSPLNTASDLALLADALRAHGYKDEDINAIMHGNWLRVLQRIL
ncbi:MAG: dipeptidase [Anaerolineae bacterium]|nr:dipeptidase [Anaerolineae bacterium]